jgi:hypothetical protein
MYWLPRSRARSRAWTAVDVDHDKTTNHQLIIRALSLLLLGDTSFKAASNIKHIFLNNNE